MKKIKAFFKEWVWEWFLFVRDFARHVLHRYLSPSFYRMEAVKSFAVVAMYQQRGKNAQLFVNGTLLLVVLLGVTIGPSLVMDNGQIQMAMTESGSSRIVFAAAGPELSQTGVVLGTSVDATMETQYSDKPRSEILTYTVESGDTLSVIANKFGVSMDTIRWENSDIITSEKVVLKPGMVLKVPPVTGIVHTVKSGETIYSIAKKYNVDPQQVVDYPFNSFTNDETFALAIGQQIIVPEGVMPAVQLWSPSSSLARVLTPSAGAVSATGSWIWPAAGRITQGFLPWHKGIDVASKDGGVILAADSGTVVVAGWPDSTGYGNRVIIDHGNGFKTLYGHLARISVVAGQTVKRGDRIGDMGSTGRSTGTHLHFEIRYTKGGLANPLEALK